MDRNLIIHMDLKSFSFWNRSKLVLISDKKSCCNLAVEGTGLVDSILLGAKLEEVTKLSFCVVAFKCCLRVLNF